MSLAPSANMNAKIHVKNVETTVEGIPPFIIGKLYNEIAFVRKGDEWSERVATGKWDGVRRLYNKWTGAFPTGLLSIVRKVLDDNGVEYAIHDDRSRPSKNRNWSVDLPWDLRYYQEETVQECLKIGRGVCSLPTASGKTVMFSTIIGRLNVAPVIVYVPSLLLLDQTAAAIREFVRDENGNPVEVGMVGDGKCEIKSITVMTVQTAITAYNMYFDRNKGTVRKLSKREIAQQSKEGYKSKRKNKEDPDASEDLSFLQQKKIAIRKLIEGARVVICDECFPYDARVSMPDGTTRYIGELVNEKYEGEVMSWNQSTEKIEPKRVTGHIRKKPSFPMVQVCTEMGEFIQCTSNHLLLTSSGWKAAGDIQNGDMIARPRLNDKDTPNEHLQWTPVISIDASGSLGDEAPYDDVYCLEVESNHNFIANGYVVHNCHRAASFIYQEVLKRSQAAYYRYAFSATPYREDGTEMLISASFGRIIYQKTHSELVREGFLARPYIYIIDIPASCLPKSQIDTYQKEMKEYIVKSEARNQMIASITKQVCDIGPTMLLVIEREHGKALEKLIPGSVFIHGGTTKSVKDKAISDMLTGEIPALIATPIGDEGLDLVELRVLVLCHATKSEGKLHQRIGRTSRKHEGKDNSIIIDFLDSGKYLSKHGRKREQMYLTENEWVICKVGLDGWKSIGS